MHREAEKLLEEVSFLYQKYSDELRATTQPYQLARVQAHIKDYEYDATHAIIRESLLEHIGALTMLAIHDIGELIVGDVSTFKKKQEDATSEYEAGISLLDPMYHDLYDQAEKKSNPTAKFAKAIDKIAPDILDYLTPGNLTIKRFKQLYDMPVEGIVPLIIKYKRPYMLWNPFMTAFHDLLMREVNKKLQG